jgi:hypothetical protein
VQSVVHQVQHDLDRVVDHPEGAGALLEIAGDSPPCLAIIIAWGLMDPGGRSAHGLPHNSDAELIEAFQFVTGTDLEYICPAC